jgi:hypothetical protein
MSEKIELELKLKGGDKAVKTLGQLEQELNDAREAIKEVEVGSDAFKKLATKIQDASSEVKTLEKQMEGLEPQQKTEAFLKLGEGIAGGFAIGQASMALLGLESENLEKLQVKVQSAIAIAQGARMISEAALMATTAKRVAMEKIGLIQTKGLAIWTKALAAATAGAAVVQKLFTGAVASTGGAFKALKIAIMSTGIGALVVLIGAMVVGIMSWVSSSKEQSKAQKELNAQLLSENEAILNNIKLRREKSQADSEEEVQLINLREQRLRNEAAITRNNEAIKKNNELMAEGVSKKLQKKLIDENERRTAGNLKLEKKIDLLYAEADAVQATIDANNDLSAAEQKILDDKEAKRKERADQRKSDAAELFKLEQELSLMRIEDEDKRNKAKLEQDKQNALEAVVGQEEQIKLIKEKYALLEAERLQAIEDAEFEKFIAKNDKWNEAQLKKQEERIAKETAAEEKAAAKQQELDAKVAEFKDGLGAQSFELAKQLGGKNEKIQKGIAVAETIFNTQKAVMRAVADIPAPFGVVQAGIHGAMGVLAVNNILNENMGGVEGGATTEPMTPASTGAFSLGGGIEQEPIKTYVITDELTDSQAQLAEIRRRTIL